ncbi:MAG: hypothetical protein ACI4NP_04305 [Thermoguttaceae bacterium]
MGKGDDSQMQREPQPPAMAIIKVIVASRHKVRKVCKIWALSGVTKDGKGVNDSARYIRYHESG